MKTAKAWTAIAGTLVSSLCVTYSPFPDEVCAALGTVVTGLLVYLIPNAK